MSLSSDKFPANVDVDVRWRSGGIGRFSSKLVLSVAGGGALLDGRFRPSSPLGSVELAVRFHSRARAGAVLFSPGFMPPAGWEHRSIVTVHDLMYLDPALASRSQLQYFSRVVMPQLGRCRLLLTVSEDSARGIRNVLRDGPEVVVVGNGVDPELLEAGRRGDRTRTLLFVGGDKRNKNLGAALRASALARRQLEFELAVVGSVSDSVVRNAPAGTRFLGEVSDRELIELYGTSTALLMPSLDEGFGLPALESMAAGTPVIYGARGALPEVVGHHGWAVDPTDAVSISSAIVSSLLQPIEITDRERVAIVDAHRWADVATRVVAAVRSTL